MEKNIYLLTIKSLQGKYLGKHAGYEAAVRCSKQRADPGMVRPAFRSCLAYNLQSISSRPKLVRSPLVLGQSASVCLQGCIHWVTLPAVLRARLFV